eukprot:TRINITY_DN34808_c0_g1_i1.p1 TRINITY_DN34808_c0_g1~~TRINITY_DN34808_c0_g1_i1.p1  ORF type:complete len:120 (-),score=19.59 TRINITY_DN34808_c0_g1_i1:15-374(-)
MDTRNKGRGESNDSARSAGSQAPKKGLFSSWMSAIMPTEEAPPLAADNFFDNFLSTVDSVVESEIRHDDPGQYGKVNELWDDLPVVNDTDDTPISNDLPAPAPPPPVPSPSPPAPCTLR